MRSVSARSSTSSRLASAMSESVLIWPLAIWVSRLPSAAIRPQPVVPRPGSRPRMIMIFRSPGRGSGWGGLSSFAEAARRPELRVPLPAGKREGEESTQLLHDLVGDFVIAPDGLDVVIVLQRVDQLHQRRRIAFVHFDGGLGLPGELGAFRRAELGLQRPGDFVQRVHGGPDLIDRKST